jgi:hypothetical protein
MRVMVMAMAMARQTNIHAKTKTHKQGKGKRSREGVNLFDCCQISCDGNALCVCCCPRMNTLKAMFLEPF